MARRTALSLEQLSESIECIYRAGLDGSGWDVVLQRIATLFQSTSVAVWLENPKREFLEMNAIQQSEELTSDYAKYYHRLDYLRPAVVNAQVGTILTNEMVIPKSNFIQSEFYTDFASRYDFSSCMQAHVFDGPGCSGYIGIGRSKQVGSFEEYDVRLLSLLIPHIRVAQETRRHLEFASIQRETALTVLDQLSQGVIIVDSDARVIHANSAAEALLRGRDGLVTRQGQLCAIHTSDEGALKRALGAGVPSPSNVLAVTRPSGLEPLILIIQRIQTGYELTRNFSLLAGRSTSII